MFSLYYAFLLIVSLAITLLVINVVSDSFLITSGLVIDPDFNSWTCNRCWMKIEEENKETLTKKVRSHLRSKHSFLGRYFG